MAEPAPAAAPAAGGAPAAPPVKNHNKYRKEKPWDHDGIEHWKVDVSHESRVECAAGPRRLPLLY